MFNVTSTAMAAVCTLGLVGGAHASVIAYDGFEGYAPGSGLIGQNLGSGWTTSWESNALPSSTIEVTERSLIGGGQSGGAHALTFQNVLGGTEQNPTSNAGQGLLRSFPQQSGTTYFSFILRAENFGGNEFINFYVGHSMYPTESGDRLEIMGAGIRNVAGNPFYVRIGQSAAASGTTAFTDIDASPAPTDASAAFQVILKVSKSESNFFDTADLWVFDADTAIPGSEPDTATATAFRAVNLTSLDRISLRVLNVGGEGFENETLLLDEIRISSTWGAVVPEPIGLSTIGIAAAALLGRRRRTATC